MTHANPVLSVRISPLLLARVQLDAAAANLTVSQHTRARLSDKTVAARINPLCLHDMAQLVLRLQTEDLPHLADELREIMRRLQ